MTRSAVARERVRAPRTAAFVDLTGRDRVKRIAMVATAAVAVLIYANALANGFALDDGGVIVRNPLVTSGATAWRALALPYWPDTLGGGQYRPLGILAFALDWAVSGGDPRWFHAMNILWHAAATVLVWMLASELLAPVAAGIAALAFAIHPVHVEAVANVVGRLEPMATTFVLAGLLAHRHQSRFAPVWFALALLSKESAVVLLALAAANDLVLERDWRAAFRSRRWLYAGYGGVAVAYAAVLAAVFHARALSVPARAFAGITAGQRLELVSRVVPQYVRLLVAPMQLSASYAPNVISPGAGITVAGALGVATIAVGVAALVAAHRRRWPLVTFALLWIPITIAPVSNVLFATGVVLAERTLYLASVGVCLAAGAIAERFLVARPVMVLAATASVTLAFAVRTWTRTPVWRDDRAYVLTLLAEHPESYEAHLAAGRALAAAGSLESADRELAVARRIFPRDSLIYHEAAQLADRRAQPALASALRDSARIARTLPLPRR